MPKMFVHAPEGVFHAGARERVAAALTDLGLACEHLPDTAAVRNSVWVFFADHAPDAVFTGGRMASGPAVSLTIYTIESGLDGPAKHKADHRCHVHPGRAWRVTGTGARLCGRPRCARSELGHVR